MAKIIYSTQRIERTPGSLDEAALRTLFAEAAKLHQTLLQAGKKIAYCFIDPLINSFEAANHFYFRILGISCLNRLSSYKSGAGPIQALADTQELLDHGLYDAVFICGYEPLLSNKIKYGKLAIEQGMRIFEEASLLACYNELTALCIQKLNITAATFEAMAEALWQNYLRTFTRIHPGETSPQRGPKLDAHDAPLFHLTDCANPNLDFAGVIVVASNDTLKCLEPSPVQPLDILAVHYTMVEGNPLDLKKIVGSADHLFPHLQAALAAAQYTSGLNIAEEVKAQRMLLDLYTCYPPIPLAFLMSSGLAKNIPSLLEFLAVQEITLDGGLNLAGAPWNNPVLSSLVTLHQCLPHSSADYALIHGNGGIGEIQGLALLSRIKD